MCLFYLPIFTPELNSATLNKDILEIAWGKLKMKMLSNLFKSWKLWRFSLHPCERNFQIIFEGTGKASKVSLKAYKSTTKQGLWICFWSEWMIAGNWIKKCCKSIAKHFFWMTTDLNNNVHSVANDGKEFLVNFNPSKTKLPSFNRLRETIFFLTSIMVT